MKKILFIGFIGLLVFAPMTSQVSRTVEQSDYHGIWWNGQAEIQKRSFLEGYHACSENARLNLSGIRMAINTIIEENKLEGRYSRVMDSLDWNILAYDFSGVMFGQVAGMIDKVYSNPLNQKIPIHVVMSQVGHLLKGRRTEKEFDEYLVRARKFTDMFYK